MKLLKGLMLLGAVVCMSGCGMMNDANNEVKEKVTIQAYDASKALVDVEVPYNPERVAILDMPSLDIMDELGLGDRIVGSAKVSIESLSQYNPDTSQGAIMNLGTIKTADLEKVAACAPDVIFIGGRLASVYEDLAAIAPVVYLGVDYEKGIVESTKDNAMTIASIFGKEAEVEAKFNDFQPRIDALEKVLKDKKVLLGMYNANALGLLGTQSQLNLLVNELGAFNLSETVGEEEKASHGEEASWETILTLNPEYMFILDRSSATQSEDGTKGVKEVVENELIKGLDVYKNDKIVYFVENANVWYTATGGIKALDIMLSDLEAALLK